MALEDQLPYLGNLQTKKFLQIGKFLSVPIDSWQKVKPDYKKFISKTWQSESCCVDILTGLDNTFSYYQQIEEKMENKAKEKNIDVHGILKTPDGKEWWEFHEIIDGIKTMIDLAKASLKKERNDISSEVVLDEQEIKPDTYDRKSFPKLYIYYKPSQFLALARENNYKIPDEITNEFLTDEDNKLSVKPHRQEIYDNISEKQQSGSFTDIETKSERFIKKLTVRFKDDETITIQEPGKRPNSVSADFLEFKLKKKSTNVTWEAFLEVLQDFSEYFFRLRGNKNRKGLLKTINKKLLDYFKKNYDFDPPEGYKLWERVIGKGFGLYKFKFKISIETDKNSVSGSAIVKNFFAKAKEFKKTQNQQLGCEIKELAAQVLSEGLLTNEEVKAAVVEQESLSKQNTPKGIKPEYFKDGFKIENK